MELGIRDWLLIIGALLLIILLIDGYRRIKQEQSYASRATNDSSLDPYDDPLISDDSLEQFDDSELDTHIPILMDSVVEDEPLSMDISDKENDLEAVDSVDNGLTPQVLVIHLNAKVGYVFEGKGLVSALDSCGLKYGSMKIFHRYSQIEGNANYVLFSVANAVEPGYFDLQNLDTLETPGISLFLEINNHLKPEQALNDMIETAYKLSDMLAADLKDEHRNVLTKQTLTHYKERIQNYRRLSLSKRSV